MRSHLFFFLALGLLTSCSQLKSIVGNNIESKSFQFDNLWVRNTLAKNYYGYRHPQRMSPLIYNGTIIQGNAIDGIGAFDINTGNIKWFRNIKGGVEGGGVIEKDTLYAGAGDGFFYALNANNGDVKWKTPINAETLSRPTYLNGYVYFIAGNNRIYTLESATGKVKWSYSRQETSSLSIRGGSQPTIHNGLVYLGFSDGYLVALAIEDGKLKWEKLLNKNRRFRDIDAMPVVENDRLYIAGFDEAFYCLDANTGVVQWQHDQGGYSAATLSSDRLFYTTTDGYVVSLYKNSGKVDWRYKLKSGLGTQPTLYRGLVIFGEYEGNLVALDEKNGKWVNSYAPGRGIMSRPTIDPKTGKAYFISVNANLFAMKLNWRAKNEEWPWDKSL